jgi:hypothetical protein
MEGWLGVKGFLAVEEGGILRRNRVEAKYGGNA